MVFSSSIFLFAFLPIVFLFYFVIFRKKRKPQNIFLFIVSIVFYAWGEPIFVLLMLATIVVNWFCAIRINKTACGKNKLWLTLGIVYNVGILFVFKYLLFVLDNLNLIFNTNLLIKGFSLPIGISFFTFQAMSYLIDVYRGKDLVQRNLLYVGLYISFFPQLIAGPIVRYETVADQINNRTESYELFSEGTARFIFGLSKKVILANSLAIIADTAFGGTTLACSMAWLGAIAYALQIFFDFSGYSDMAIGLGKMFGFKFNENFNYPYTARSISEFWRRWHISMGTWFRDYVYFPLGGSRVKKPRMILNLFIVWLLTGLWHGANWTFIVWGLYYFCFIVIEKLIGKKLNSVPKVFGVLYTLILVLFGWVLFRSDNIAAAFTYFKAMFSFGSGGWDITLIYIKENAVILVFGVLACMPIVTWCGRVIKNEYLKLSLKIIVLIILAAVSVVYVVKGTYNPFIYFNF
ncbi:MAG: MBOAT family protein [Clostridia bacterium]|nr:MBOAT family protein [Clostridia bacterium]MBO4518218.1 MBOAT family protein [Clostridia bacterium]